MFLLTGSFKMLILNEVIAGVPDKAGQNVKWDRVAMLKR